MKTSPEVIGIRLGELSPLVEKWQRQNPKVSASRLLRSALKQSRELRGLAGKRYAHLVAEVQP